MARAKKNKTRKPVKDNIIDDFILPFKDERIIKIIGIILISFSILLFASFISFFFTGGIDQSKLDMDASEYIMNSNVVVNNVAGKFGAYISELFINKGFGIASFIFVYFFFTIGLQLLGFKQEKLKKNMFISFVAILWFSFCFAYMFDSFSSEIFVFLGGSYGYFIQKWTTSLLGGIGTFALLVVSFISIMTFSFKSFLPSIVELFSHPKKSFDTRIMDKIRSDSSSIEDQSSNGSDDDFIGSLSPNGQDVDIPDNVEFDSPAEFESSSKETVELDLGINHKLTDNFTSEAQKQNSVDIEMTIQNEGVADELVDRNIVPQDDYDPTLELSSFKFPDIDLLAAHDANNTKVSASELDANKNKIVETLRNYKIDIIKIMATIGPTVTLYEIVPAPGVRISKIKNLEDDIALSLSALGIRIIAPIPGKGTVGIEVPNLRPEIVSMRSIIASKAFQESKYDLPIALGKTISNETFTFDLAKMPHLLVAGATGQGKSVGLNAIITSLLYKKHPSQLKFVMVDPKKVELSIYSVLEKFYLAKLPDAEDPIITDVGKVVATLNSICIEMDNRYDLLKNAHVRNLKEYNTKFVKRRLNPEKGHKYLPYIVVVVDEFADLIMTAGKEVEQPIARIAQLARAVGIHMIIATQRPSTNIITGIIKANFPARIAFKVASMIDSRTILDTPGANQLIGRGDMLFSVNSNLTRVQCAFVDTPEVDAITRYIHNQKSYDSAFMLPEYVPEDSATDGMGVDLGVKDPMFEEAARLIVNSQQGSTSSIQRRFSLGYNRAGRIMDQLEAAGIVGPSQGSKPRNVLIPDEYSLEKML
ncbi:MAG: DNA translocase FtsK 4TM domain-containing protein [Marinifilaceae bacterium]